MSATGRLILFLTLNALSFLILIAPSSTATNTAAYYSTRAMLNLNWLPVAVAVLLAYAAPKALQGRKCDVVFALLAYIALQGLPCIPTLSVNEKADALMTVTKAVSIIGAVLVFE